MGIPEIDVQELARQRAAGALLVDVREDDEFVDARVPGAQHIPLAEVPERIDEVPTSGTVYVICAQGARSAKAAEHYRQHGIDAVNVAGGTLAWIDAGLPTDSGSGDPGAVSADAPPAHRWIDRTADFAALVELLREVEVYGLDTEFHRERTYHAQLALLQLSWPGGVAVVDPLAVDVTPFCEVLAGPGVCLMHAASQDLEILQRICGTVPTRLFDTQVAAGFVGYTSVGLAGLVQGQLGVKLPKADRLTDWMAPRPLPTEAEVYAAADVEHLHELHQRLVADLERRGRLQWALDECEVVRTRPTTAQVPDRAWWKIKEARSLRGRAAAVAQALAAWRERRAAEVDRPVRFLLADLALVSMAQRPPREEADLRRVRGLDDGKRKGSPARELLAAVGDGLALPLESVELPPSDGVDRSRRAAASLVSAWAAQRARDLEIDPAILATRSDIEAFLMGSDGRLATGWRHDVVGAPIRALAAGEASLAVDGNGHLVLEGRSGVAFTDGG